MLVNTTTRLHSPHILTLGNGRTVVGYTSFLPAGATVIKCLLLVTAGDQSPIPLNSSTNAQFSASVYGPPVTFRPTPDYFDLILVTSQSKLICIDNVPVIMGSDSEGVETVFTISAQVHNLRHQGEPCLVLEQAQGSQNWMLGLISEQLPTVATRDIIIIGATFLRRDTTSDGMRPLLVFQPVLTGGPDSVVVIKEGVIRSNGFPNGSNVRWRDLDLACAAYLKAQRQANTTPTPPATPLSTSGALTTSSTTLSSPTRSVPTRKRRKDVLKAQATGVLGSPSDDGREKRRRIGAK